MAQLLTQQIEQLAGDVVEGIQRRSRHPQEPQLKRHCQSQALPHGYPDGSPVGGAQREEFPQLKIGQIARNARAP